MVEIINLISNEANAGVARQLSSPARADVEIDSKKSTLH